MSGCRRQGLGKERPHKPHKCGGHSAERERQWKFPQQSRGVPRRLSANPVPRRARDNQTRQGFRLSSSALLPQTLGLYRQARGFCEGWTNHIKGQIVICHSCTNHVKGQILIYHSCTNHIKGQVAMRFVVTRVYGDHALSTCSEIKRANQKF